MSSRNRMYPKFAFTLLFLLVMTTSSLKAQEPAGDQPAPPAAAEQPTIPGFNNCESEVEDHKRSAAAFSSALNKFNEENPPGETPKPQACVGGVVRWEKTSWKMDVPEITMKRIEWKTDIPETWLGQQEWLVKEAIVVCEDRKVGQYPQTRCEDTWVEAFGIKTKGVPNCTVTWHDIITKVCWPETRDKRIILGVPEFKMTTRTMSMDLPEVTMKTQEMSLHLPQFFAESGCIAADCSDKCKAKLNEEMEQQGNARNAAIAPAKTDLLAKTTTMFQCQGTSLSASRDFALSQYDKFISVADATLREMRAQGLDGPASEQEKRVLEMKAERQKVQDDLDKMIAAIQEDEKKAVTAIGG